MHETVDPFSYDFNSDELINGMQLMNKPVKNIGLQVISITRKDLNEKPRMMVTFMITEGEDAEKIVFDYFYGSKAAAWRIRELIVACGHYHPDIRNGKPVKAVNEGATIYNCEGQTLKADLVSEISDNGNSYIRVKNMRPED